VKTGARGAAGTRADYGCEAERRGGIRINRIGLAQYAARTARVAGRIYSVSTAGLRSGLVGTPQRLRIASGKFRRRRCGFAAASIQSRNGGDGAVCRTRSSSPGRPLRVLTPGMEAWGLNLFGPGSRSTAALCCCGDVRVKSGG